MKIIIGSKAYLQKYDLNFIIRNLGYAPVALMSELFANNGPFAISNPQSAYEFIEFSDPFSVGWIREQDWLVDQDEFAQMSARDLKDFHTHLIKSQEDDIRDFNARDEKWRQEKQDTFSQLMSKANHRIRSFAILRDYRLGKLTFTYPPELAPLYPATNKPKQGFFARLFHLDSAQ